MSLEQRSNNLGIDPKLLETDPTEHLKQVIEAESRLRQQIVKDKRIKESNTAETPKPVVPNNQG